MLSLKSFSWTYSRPDVLEKAYFWQRKDGTVWTHQDPKDPKTKVVPYDPAKHKHANNKLSLEDKAKKFGLDAEQVEHALNVTPTELDWVLGRMSGPNPEIRLPEDADKVRNVLAQLHKAKNKVKGLNLQQYKSFDQLRTKMEEIFGSDKPVEKDDWREALQGEEPVYEDKENGIKVWRFDNSKKDKLMQVAAHTDWCVQGEARAEEYTSQGPLHLVTVGGKRLMLEHTKTNQLKNVRDVEITLLTPEMAEALSKSGSKLKRKVTTRDEVLSSGSPFTALQFSALSTKRDPELENIIAKDAKASFEYAVGKGYGFRFEQGESKILGSDFYAKRYKAHLGTASVDELTEVALHNRDFLSEIYWKKYPKEVQDAVKRRAVEEDPHSIINLDNPSEELQQLAVSGDADLIEYVRNPSETTQLIAVRNSGKSIAYIKNPTPAVQELSVEKNPRNIEHIKNPSPEIQLKAVQASPYSIIYIDNPTEAAQLAAVSSYGGIINSLYENDVGVPEPVILAALKQDGNAIKYVRGELSEEMQMTAVTNDGNALVYITSRAIEPSDPVKMTALANRPTAIQWIKDPTPEMKAKAKEGLLSEWDSAHPDEKKYIEAVYRKYIGEEFPRSKSGA